MLLLCTQATVFAQGNNVPAVSAELPPTNNIDSDSLTPRAVFNLLSFTGTSSSGQATLAWKTDSRSHFSEFVLERGIDENSFSAVGEVLVAASNKTNSFTYVDGKPGIGRNFYRLKMTDSSGNSTYSTTIAVTHIPINNLQVHYAASSGTVALAGMEASLSYQLKVYNCNGQLMLQKAVATTAPSISISQLPHGLYVVYATDGVTAPVGQKIIW